MNDVTNTILNAHRAADPPLTLLMDELEGLEGERGVLHLAQAKRAPEELWALPAAGKLKLVVLSGARSARELYRVIVLAERLVAPGGAILITADPSGERRIEAVETFCAIYPWGSKMLGGGVIELRRSLGDTKAQVRPADPSVASASSKCVVSLSIFGPDGEHGYWKWLPTYVRAHHTLFPGYELRIHHDESIYNCSYGDVLHGLQRRGLVKLVFVSSKLTTGKCEKMLWRLLPCWDPEVDYVFCRDVDSLPTWRDRMCCEEFIASGYDVGVIHDDPQHVGIMGGLCHFKAKAPETFEKFIATARYTDEKWNAHGADQEYLNSLISGVRTRGILEHSLFTTELEGGVRAHRSEPTIKGADFRTAIHTPSQDVIDSVPVIVRERSDLFTNYIGAAGMWKDDAETFYKEHCPVEQEICEAETFAGWRS